MLARLRHWLGLGRGETEPNLPAVSRPAPIEPRGENLLIVSDLHLGEACKDHSRIEYLKRGSLLDADLCRFLEHHAARRRDGLPWRLVLAGDLIDFLQVTIAPADASPHERRYGLDTREEHSVWKLERLMDRHRMAFVYLADFVGAGNRLELVQGNHDEELFWPAVRRAFVEGLVRIYFGGEAHPGESPEAFRERIHFNSWFYYQPGLIYVEHGHRFDEFCSTPPQLCPLQPRAEDELWQPVSGLAIRYFANQERGFRTHDKEHWGIREYYAYYRRQGLGRVLRAAARYGHLISEAVRYYLRHGRYRSDRAAREHAARIAAMAESGVLEPERLRGLDDLGAGSVTADPFGLYTALGGAEWTAAALVALALGVTLPTAWGWLVDLMLLGSAAAGGVAWVGYARRRFPTNTPFKLETAARRISELLDVAIVAMGHSHRPIRLRMPHDHRAFYVNSGAFLPPERPAHGADEPCRCPVTFVEVPHPGPHGRAVPELKRWCCVRSEPATL